MWPERPKNRDEKKKRALWLLLHCLFDGDGIKLTEEKNLNSWQEGVSESKKALKRRKEERYGQRRGFARKCKDNEMRMIRKTATGASMKL